MRWKLEVFGALALAAGLWILLAKHPAFMAQRWNADGVGAYRKGNFAEARRHFEKALGTGLWAHVIRLNNGDAHLGELHWAQAHENYQKALEVRGDYGPAVWNDGLALEAWGRTEIDSNFCHIDRALELWGLSAERFAALADTRAWGKEARLNLVSISNNIKTLRALHESNKDKCGGGGGGGGSTAGSPNPQTGKNPGASGPQTQNGQSPPPAQGKPEELDDQGNPIPSTAGQGPLSPKQEEMIEEARGRIGRDGRGVTFRQTSAQQLRRGTNRVNVGRGLYK